MLPNFLQEEGIDSEIGWDDKSFHYTITFPASTTDEPGFASYLNGLISLLTTNYRYRKVNPESEPEKEKFEVEFVGAAAQIALEGLRNAKYHGSPSNTPFEHHMYLGRFGVCHGIHDEGGFFNRKVNKEIFENKVEITEFTPHPKCHQLGVNNYIYRLSDTIKVDTSEGILYCVKKLTLPTEYWIIDE